ncbi:MAG: DUF6273 domain-containing protein [Flavonifractor plautii]
MWWWLRSPKDSNSNSLGKVNGGGDGDIGNAYYSAGVRPGFAV